MNFIHPRHDRWHTVSGEDGPVVTLTPAPHSLLSLTQWHAIRAQWPAGMPVGVELPNDSELAAISDDLPRIALVVLHFPKWTDGRAYSQARVLRSRHRFAGEIRAIGDVVVDMMPLLQRCGFDAVVLRGDQSRATAERALGFFPGHYQGDVRQRKPIFARPADELKAASGSSFIETGAAI
ncbi:DUF934 domain-containing protein [Piscinibacter sakaiensis]|uniref:DUF934 domain-containing protein n=1 Tax=Piscinibacter sakaiensis TaxID=1547922 RepID=UPI003AAFC152